LKNGAWSDRINRIDRIKEKAVHGVRGKEVIGFSEFIELVGLVELKNGAKAQSVLGAIIFSIAFSMVPVGCSGPVGHELVLNDFETDADLDRVRWQCRTLFSLSSEHATSGESSMKMELFPADYPGLSLKLDERDWSRYDSVAFDIYNPQDETLEITVRIDDREDYPDYDDRYNGRITLMPGSNDLRIPLNSLRTAGTDRSLNLKTIERFLFFLVDTNKTFRLYVDNIRLTS
jgi:hypothetical protein